MDEPTRARLRRRAAPWAAFALAVVADAAIAITDATSAHHIILIGLVVLAPLALAVVASPAQVAVVSALSIVLVIVAGTWDGFFGHTDHVLRTAVVTVGSVLAVLGARARVAAAQNALQLARTRNRLDGILAALAEAVTVHDARGKTVYANPAAARLLGAGSVEDVLRAEPGELGARFSITGEDGTPVAIADMPGRRAVEGKPAEPLLTRSIDRVTGADRWLLTKATIAVDDDGRPLAINVIEDVTEAKLAEQRQRFLAEAGELLSSSLELSETLERVAQLAVPGLADWCAVDILDEPGRLQRLGMAHADPGKLALGRELHRRYPPDLSADAAMAGVVERGESVLYPEISDEMLAAGIQDPERLALTRAIGMRSAMVVPMRIGERAIGALTFVTAESLRVFDADDLAFAQEIARRAAVAVENSRLYTERSAAADTLQRSLLPERLPRLAGFAIAASYHPGARGTEVGGDFYDVFAVGRGFMVVLGDVTGKGVRAAALTSLARHTARNAAVFVEPRPAEVLRRVDGVLRDRETPALVTVACAMFEVADGGVQMTVASGGHPLPIRVTAGGEVSEVGHHGMLLGAFGDTTWREERAVLHDGDTVLFYTDGVIDTPGSDRRFGEDRLLGGVALAPRDPDGLVAAVDAAVVEFQHGRPGDDRAMIALQLVNAEVAAAVRRADRRRQSPG